jgi:HD-GYP domain-containing protein (c-di-GMP phosphodiesterase class II)
VKIVDNDQKDEPDIGRTGEFSLSELAKVRAAATAKLNQQEEAAGRIEPSTGGASSIIPTSPDYYPEPSKFDRELKRGYEIYESLVAAATTVIDGARAGLALDVRPLIKPLSKMIASVIQHPDAMIWMRKLHHHESYLIGHSVRCSVLATVLARDMGLAEPQLERVAMGGVLCQIGKTKLPRNLLEKSDRLSSDEMDRIHGFVGTGVEMLTPCLEVGAEVVEIVANHHERFDGSGYPSGKRGDQIPVLARLVGLVDWYDAMTSKKPYTKRVASSTEAMDYLYLQRDHLFQSQVIEEFIQALGIYPNGNLVELNTGEVALIQSQNLKTRTQPEIILVLDRDKQHYPSYDQVNLSKYNLENPDYVRIIKTALGVGAFDLDPNKIIEAGGGKAKGWRKFF